MDMQFKERFVRLWEKHFPQAPLPVVFFYSDDEAGAAIVNGPKSLEEHRCILADITRAARGRSLAFNVDSIGCGGGSKYLGFSEVLRPNFEYFLSCGIPGELEGEKYKKSPELVGKVMKKMPKFIAPARYIVFKRWDGIDKNDNPDVVIFFATPDVLSGLFTLANYDGVDPNGVFCPFGAGCSTIVTYPYLERNARRPKSVIGMFDVSARPCVPANTLTFATPFKRFVTMVDNMDESFLITESWKKVRRRIKKG